MFRHRVRVRCNYGLGLVVRVVRIRFVAGYIVCPSNGGDYPRA